MVRKFLPRRGGSQSRLSIVVGRNYHEPKACIICIPSIFRNQWRRQGLNRKLAPRKTRPYMHNPQRHGASGEPRRCIATPAQLHASFEFFSPAQGLLTKAATAGQKIPWQTNAVSSIMQGRLRAADEGEGSGYRGLVQIRILGNAHENS